MTKLFLNVGIYVYVYTFKQLCDIIHNDYINEGKVKTMEITKNIKIGELLQAAPEKAEILLEAGMHCLGCPASQAETLEEACEVHGINVDELVEKLNA